jgi:3-oxoacyl-[acyl-carrier protein] reductase
VRGFAPNKEVAVVRRYEGKSVLVTGAAHGIGRAYAEAFAAEGAGVTIADIDGEGAKTAAAGIEGSLAVAVDVADEEAVSTMVVSVVERFGGVDVLVNNAGLHMGVYNQCVSLPADDWRRLLDVNVIAPVLCARYCTESMNRRGGGVILNQSSNSSYLGVGAYSISKLALNGVTVSMARELASEGIRVVGIAPGMVASDAVIERLGEDRKEAVLGGQLIKRFGAVNDLIGMVLLLCSDQTSFMTGQTVIVDGGYVRQV